MPTLLLADDSLTIQRVIELTFADEDISVVAVSDGDEAIARLDAAPPDIVLADIGMPGKSGYEVAEHVKGSPALAHIPVILLTGAFEPVDQERADRAGCDGVLAKPFEPQFVINRVKELLARPRPAAAVSDLEAPAKPAPDSVEEYFDRLDAAFADLSANQPLQMRQLERGPEVSAPALDDWDIAPPPAAPVSMPTPTPLSKPALSKAAQARSDNDNGSAQSAGAANAGHVLSLSDAFALLLAAEQSHANPASAPIWPQPAPAPAVDIDALADIAAKRALEQLSDTAVRETVAELVSTIAERLVIEEIDRIKASLK